MVGRVAVAVILLAVALGWAYRAIQPPPPRTCGSPHGPPITSPRVQLSDGRHLSFKESGVPREGANYRIVFVHGFGSSKDVRLDASPDLVEELGIYFLTFDRAGYGESDPNPKRTVKSDAMDIVELADQLDLGPRFHIIGVSLGGYPTWGCIKHIPHRLAGAALVAPAISYWWSSFPAELSREAYQKLPVPDRVTYWIARNAPSLLYGWFTQKLFPASSLVSLDPVMFSPQDIEIMEKSRKSQSVNESSINPLQQGEFESTYRDMMVVFGDWGFNPTELTNPFPHNEGSIHIWQGYEDRIVPVEMQRYIAKKLPWIRYHECLECGHMFLSADGWTDRVLKALLTGVE